MVGNRESAIDFKLQRPFNNWNVIADSRLPIAVTLSPQT